MIKSDADFITFSEVRNYNGDWIKRILILLKEKGYVYYGANPCKDVAAISKYPFKKTYDCGGALALEHCNYLSAYEIEFETKNKNIKLLLFSIHLDYRNHAVFPARGYSHEDLTLLDDGNGNPLPIIDAKTLLEYNALSYKDEGILQTINFAKEMEREKHFDAVIITGDFNDASHLDWTEKTKDLMNHNGAVVPWNSTLLLEKNGYIDSYRKLYPNERTHYGVTWPVVPTGFLDSDVDFKMIAPFGFIKAKTTSWTPLADDRDRLDYIFYKGNVEVVEGYLAGPKTTFVKNTPHETEFDDKFIFENEPWPTDHRGLIMDFKIK